MARSADLCGKCGFSVAQQSLLDNTFCGVPLARSAGCSFVVVLVFTLCGVFLAHSRDLTAFDLTPTVESAPQYVDIPVT